MKLSCLLGGFAPRTPQFFLDTFSFIFQKMCFLMDLDDRIEYFEEKNNTMIPGAKNAAGWWSSFVCSLSVAPFREGLRF